MPRVDDDDRAAQEMKSIKTTKTQMLARLLIWTWKEIETK